MAKVVEIKRDDERGWYRFQCPGCGHAHTIPTKGGQPTWTFNGDVNKPTFSPSILMWYPKDGKEDGEHITTCHSFVNNGMIQFLSDCKHSLADKTVELPECE